MKKVFTLSMFLLLGASSLSASYFSIREAGFKEDTNYQFLGKNSDKLLVTYDDGEFEFKQKGKELHLFTEKSKHHLKSMNTMKQLISKGLRGEMRDKETFQVYDDGNYYYGKVLKKHENYNAEIFSGDTKASFIDLKIIEAISKDGEDLETSSLGKFHFKDGILIGFELFEDTDKEMIYSLSKVSSDKLEEFLKLEAKLKTVATFDDIQKESVDLIYRSSANNSEHRLKVSLNTNAKNKNFTEVHLEGMSNVLAYGSKINQKESIYAGIHTKSLFQTVGKFKDSSANIKFKASPKKSMVLVKYGDGQQKEYSRNKKTPYYNLAGLWMMVTNPKKESIMFFDNTDTPKDFKLVKKEDEVIFEKGSHKLYTFKLQNRLVKEFDIALGKYHFELEDATSKSVLKNRKKLADFKAKYSIVEVK